MRIVCLTLLLTALAGCASAPKTPDWVHGTSRQYAAGQYLLGRGAGNSTDQAQERARADLAKIFEVSVVAEGEDVQTYSQEGADANATGQYEQRSAQRITTRTDQIVRGIRIAELWQDPETKTYHGLAVLPRLQASASLREEIGKLDDATGRYIEQSRAVRDVFAKIGAASRALELQAERAGYQKSLKVVDPTGRGVEVKWSTARLRADLDELLKRVRIAPHAAPGSDPELGPLIRGALATAGFLAETGESPDYLLEAALRLDNLGLQDGWYWQRGSVEVTLIESPANRVRGSKRWPIKASGRSSTDARRRALERADALLKKQLRDTLVGFAAD